MAFPWSRSNAGASDLPAERRRRKRQRRAGRDDSSNEKQRVSPERLHWRLSWGIGAVLVVVIAGVLAAGYYQEFYRPPTVWAGKVRDVQFTMGDLVQRIRVEQGLTGTVDLSSSPFDYLRHLLDAEILKQESARLGIGVTDELVEAVLRSRFYPVAPTGQATDPGQLDREFENNYQIFLTRTGLSEADHLIIVEEQLRLQQLYILLSSDIEDNLEQVEVEWIRLEVTGQVTPADVMARLEIESFSEVARSVGVSAGFADPSGYVGWVPSQAFPEIGLALFGDPEYDKGPLKVGELDRPIFSRDGTYIVRKLSDPEIRPLSNIMRAKLNAELVESWQKELLSQGSEQGWVKMKFNDRLYKWVADQVGVSAPRNPGAR